MKLTERIKTFLSLLARSPSLGQRNIRILHGELGIHPTPCSVVHEERSFRVLHFPPSSKGNGGPPILMVPSLINRWYVLDLLTGHSLVEALAAMGCQVYLLAWEDAHDGQGPLGLDTYIESFVHRAVLRSLRHASATRLTLLGQCLGGNMALAYAALRPDRVDRLVALTTPVDFSQGGLLCIWSSLGLLDASALCAAYPGVIPDEIVYGAFPLLNPRALLTRHRALFSMLHHEEFRRVYQAIDLWTCDHLPVASGVLRSIVEDLYQKNALWEGGWMLRSREVRLEDIRCPVLNVLAQEDEIVPPGSARPLLSRLGSERKEEFLSPMGHITLILGSPLRFETYRAIGEFCR